MKKNIKKQPTVGIFLYANQNPVSAKEADKVRRIIKNEYPDLRVRTIRNMRFWEAENEAGKYDYVLHYNTYDTNGRVWAELIWKYSTIGTNNTIIELNHRYNWEK